MLMRTEEAGLKSSVIPDATRKSSLAMGQLNVFYLRNLNLNTHTSETSFPAGSFWKENDNVPAFLVWGDVRSSLLPVTFLVQSDRKHRKGDYFGHTGG